MDNFWKGKSIIAYIALAHHTRFITPVMDQLSSLGAHVKYIVGQAERSQEITAIEKGLDYEHIFDFLTEDDIHDVKSHYNSLKNTFSKNLKKDFSLSLLPLTVIDKTLFSTAMEYIGFKNLFERNRPDLCFVLHELNRWGKMFSFWAKKNHVPFLTLQEGLGYNLDFKYSGHAQYSSLNLVWGERIKKKFSSYEVPAEKIMVTGNIHIANEIQSQKKKNVRSTKRSAYKFSDRFVALLILSSRLPSPDVYHTLFKTVSENSRLRLIVKFHPASKKPQMDAFKSGIPEPFQKKMIFIHARENIYDLISMADLCVLDQPSTTGLEALAFGKPLVKMNFGYSKTAAYSFVDQGVAVKMSVEELSDALSGGRDFSRFVDREKVTAFLNNELSDTSRALENVLAVFKKIISANQVHINPLPYPPAAPALKWSIVLPVPDRPQIFLDQLEAIAVNSEGPWEFETLLLEPDNISKPISDILDSLKGDVKRIVLEKGAPLASEMNRAAKHSKGEYLIFLDKHLAPLSGWLENLQNAIEQNPEVKLFGARICDKKGRIINAGTVIDANNAPVCAYQGLNADFAGVLKQRRFQMTDHFIAIDKNAFFELGGFSKLSGSKKFMDICLKAEESYNTDLPVLYLPNLRMIFLEDPKHQSDPDESIYFFGKWHGMLWESEESLIKEDGFTPKDLAHAKLAKAMQAMK